MYNKCSQNCITVRSYVIFKKQKTKKINYVLLKNHATCSEISVFEIVLKLFVDQKIQFAAIHNVKLRNKTVDYIERKPNF